MKKIGIVCDNYKVTGFSSALKDAGYKFIKRNFTPMTTTFVIESEDFNNDVKKIAEICRKEKIKFKNPN